MLRLFYIAAGLHEGLYELVHDPEGLLGLALPTLLSKVSSDLAHTLLHLGDAGCDGIHSATSLLEELLDACVWPCMRHFLFHAIHPLLQLHEVGFYHIELHLRSLLHILEILRECQQFWTLGRHSRAQVMEQRGALIHTFRLCELQ